jgi:hypothetical protein
MIPGSGDLVNQIERDVPGVVRAAQLVIKQNL